MSDEPWIDIQYNTLPAAPVLNASPADQAIITELTPVLGSSTVASPDPDGETVKYWLRLATNPGGDNGQIYNSGWVSDPSSLAIPPGTLQDGMTYYWKVYAGDFDPTTGVHAGGMRPSATHSFTVNLRLGAQSTNPMDAIGPVSVNLSNGNLNVVTSSPSFATVGGPIGLTFSYNSQEPLVGGLRGVYYDEGTTPNWQIDPSQTPFTVRVDPRIDFVWGPNGASPNIPSGNFLVRWKGYIRVPASGDWVFGARADDGVRIWVNDAAPGDTNRDLDQWSDRDALPASPMWSSTISGLVAGEWYPIQIDHYVKNQAPSDYGGITLYAKAAGATGDGAIVEAQDLSVEPATLPQGWRVSADLNGAMGYTGAHVGTSQVIAYDASGQPHAYTWTGTAYAPPPNENGTPGAQPQ